MICCWPPQTVGFTEGMYVLLCDDAAFPLTYNESLRACKTRQVEFVPWDNLSILAKTRALDCLDDWAAYQLAVAHAS